MNSNNKNITSETVKNVVSGNIVAGKNVNIGDTNIYLSALTEEQNYRSALLEAHWHRYDKLIALKINESRNFELTLNLGYIKSQKVASLGQKITIEGDLTDDRRVDKLVEFFLENGRLLILGEPGAGKSILLLQLAKKLIEQAKNQENNNLHSFPIPIVLSISSWQKKDSQSFEDWLAGVVQHSGGHSIIPLSDAKKLVSNYELLLLLDGFDEISETEKKSFVEELNGYIKKMFGSRDVKKKYPDVIITSRYKARLSFLTTEKRYDTAEIETFSKEQIEVFLTKVRCDGTEAIRLLKMLKEDKLLAKALNTAFFIRICLDLFSDNNTPEFASKVNSPKIRQSEILDLYIKKEIKKIPNPKSEQYLSWLAHCLKEKKKSISFELIDLQLDWGVDKKSYKFISTFVTAVFLFTIMLSWLVIMGYTTGAHFFMALLITIIGSIYTPKIKKDFFDNTNYDILKYDFKKLLNFRFWLASFRLSLLFGIYAYILGVIMTLVDPLGYQYGYNSILIFTMPISSFRIGFIVLLFLAIHLKTVTPSRLPVVLGLYKRMEARAISTMKLTAFGIVGIFLNAIWTYLEPPSLFKQVMFGGLYATPILIPCFWFITSRLVDHFIFRFILDKNDIFPFHLINFLDSATLQKGNVSIMFREGGVWRFQHQLIQDWFSIKYKKAKASQ